MGSGNAYHDELTWDIRTRLEQDCEWLFLSDDEFKFPEDRDLLKQYLPNWTPTLFHKRKQNDKGKKLVGGIDIVGVRLDIGSNPLVYAFETKTNGKNPDHIPTKERFRYGLVQLLRFQNFLGPDVEYRPHILYRGGIHEIFDLEQALDRTKDTVGYYIF